MQAQNIYEAPNQWIYVLLKHQASNTRRTKSQNLNISCIVLYVTLCNPLKPGVKSGVKMQSEKRQHAMLQLHPSDH